MKIQDALREADRRLAAAAVTSSTWDAELLLRHVLGWERAQLLTHGDETIPADALTRYDALVDARARHTPLQHLTQRQAFWRRDFEVSPDVLIPRHESEILVEALLARIDERAAPLVVDVGTGSGCIAISVACDRTDARVHAIDISPAALAVARRNAHRLGCAEHISFHQGDLLAPVGHLAGAVDAVVSNPPYVERRDAITLAPEVRDHEPAIALFPDGASDSLYRRLIPAAREVLRPSGWLLLEVGIGMAPAIVRLCADAGLVTDAPLRDLARIERVVLARKAGHAHPADRA
jgi:release factor glutamine methyltransferase